MNKEEEMERLKREKEEELKRKKYELYMEARGFVEYIKQDILNQQKDKITGRKEE